MTSEKSIYTKLEFTLGNDAAENYRFREAVSLLLQEFEGNLVGFQAQDLTSGEFHCEEAGVEEAESVLNSVFPEPQ